MTRSGSSVPAALPGKLAVIGMLVMAQSLPFMFVGSLLPALYRDMGLPLDMFYVWTIAGLPIWLKWLWAPLVDRTGSRRFGYKKSWLLPTTLLGTLVYGGLALVDPTLETLWIIVAILTLKTVVMGFQDVAVDGYAVENLGAGERSYGAGVTHVAHILGTLVASAGMLALYEVWGWERSITVAALSLLLLTLPALIRREPPPPPEKLARLESQSGTSILRGTVQTFLDFLKRRESPLVIAIIVLVGTFEGYYQGLFGAFLVDGGLSFAQIGLVFGFGLAGGGVLGAAVSSYLVRRIGLRPSVIVGAGGYTVMSAILVAMSLMAELTAPVAIAGITVGVFFAMPTAIILTTCRFRWSSPAQASTDYAIQSSLFLGSKGLGVAVAGFTGEALGYTLYFASLIPLAAAVAAFYYAAIPRIEEKMTRRTAAVPGAAIVAD